MKCDNVRSHLDGEKSLWKRLWMPIHVKRCEGCRREVSEWTGLASQIGQLAPETLPPSLGARLMADAASAAAQVRSDQSMVYADHFRLKKTALAVGFTIALLIISVNSLGFASIL